MSRAFFRTDRRTISPWTAAWRELRRKSHCQGRPSIAGALHARCAGVPSLVGSYNYWLVLLSIVVAITASYVALDLTSRVVACHGRRTEPLWLFGGAASMGSGIWSMHFIGMLAFRMPVTVSYDLPITSLSLLIAVAAS